MEGVILEATKWFKWEGAHQLSASHDLGCQEIHGHSYKCGITICSHKGVNEMGMVIDFKIIGEIVKPIINEFDHKFITFDTYGFNPTAENIALMMINRISEVFKYTSGYFAAGDLYCSKIEIWETDTCCITATFPKMRHECT